MIRIITEADRRKLEAAGVAHWPPKRSLTDAQIDYEYRRLKYERLPPILTSQPAGRPAAPSPAG
jgi:hypothetical protein